MPRQLTRADALAVHSVVCTPVYKACWRRSGEVYSVSDRDDMIRRLRAEGLSLRAITGRVGMSPMGVWKVLHRAPADELAPPRAGHPVATQDYSQERSQRSRGAAFSYPLGV